MLVGNAFPYLGLAALAVAGVWASRSEKVWRLALWSGFIVVGCAVTMPDQFTSGGVTGDLVGTTSSLVSLALALGVSIPGLVILRRVRQERSIETA